MQYLMNLLGLECTYVVSESHAWNLLKLEGDYYHLDVTWGDGSDTKAEKNSGSSVSYDCFCITTEETLSLPEHQPKAEPALPECTAVKCNYHRRNGLYFESYDENAIRMKILSTINKGTYGISFKCASKEVFDKLIKELVTEGKIYDMLKYSNLKSDNKVDLSYKYAAKEERLILTIEFNKK